MSSDDYSSSRNDNSDENKASRSEHVEENTTSEDQGEYLKVVHTDGTVNYVDNKALGGDAEAMPAGYFRSPQFIGTVTVRDTPALSASEECCHADQTD